MCARGRRPAREPSAPRVVACGSAGVPGAVGPGRPRDRHTRACGSEWSISKPARALRTLRRPPHRRRLVADVWLGASSRCLAGPRHRPRAPQPACALRSLRRPPHQCDLNVARNSPAATSNFEFASLQLQRLWIGSKSDRGKLCATFVWLWPCRRPPASEISRVKPVSPLLAQAQPQLKPPSPLRVRNGRFWRGFRLQR